MTLDRDSGATVSTPTGKSAAASSPTSPEAAAGGGRVPAVAFQAMSRNTGLEPATLRSNVVCSPIELISQLLFMRGHSVHALRFSSLSAPAGNSENPDRRMFVAKTRCDGFAVKTGHPGRTCTVTLRFVRAALLCLSYRAYVWSTRSDSNTRPHAYQTCALPAELLVIGGGSRIQTALFALQKRCSLE